VAKSNKGEVGVKSIRLNDMKIEDLPMGQGNEAVKGLPEAIENEHQQMIEEVLARYPRVTVEYLDGRIAEAQRSMSDFINTRKKTRTKIGEYRALIQSCEGRKTLREVEPQIDEIAANPDLEKDQKMRLIRELKQDCAEYDVPSMIEQIAQFEDNIERLDDAIQKENDSIAELRETKGRISIRDSQLKALGVTDIQ